MEFTRDNALRAAASVGEDGETASCISFDQLKINYIQETGLSPYNGDEGMARANALLSEHGIL